jgi:hypothetical protein
LCVRKGNPLSLFEKGPHADRRLSALDIMAEKSLQSEVDSSWVVSQECRRKQDGSILLRLDVRGDALMTAAETVRLRSV